MSGYSKNVVRGSFAFVAALAIALCIVGFAGQRVAYASVGELAVGKLDTVTTNPTYGNDADNTTGKANVRTIYTFGPSGNSTNTSETVRNLDVTGDGWADTVKVTGSKVSSKGMLSTVKVAVNGKTIKTFSNSSNYIDRVLVSVVTLKNKQPFIWVDILDGKGNATQRLYQYEKGTTYTTVLSNKDLKKRKTSNVYLSSVSASGNNVNAVFELTNTATGNTSVKYTYAWEDGTLVRTSNTSSKISYATTWGGEYTKKKLTAAGTFKVYTNTKLKTVKFTVKAGKKVQPVSVRIAGKKLLYKVKYGSKTGWIECPKIKKKSSKSPDTLFRETYGKLSLKASIPTYTFNRYMTPTDLQKYNNHSLFIARNEIYARHGYTFSNVELQKYFSKKSWYNPKRKYGLNKIERANANLMLSIEQNRGSLYIA